MQDPYPATFQRRHHNVTPVPPFYTRNNNLGNTGNNLSTSILDYALTLEKGLYSVSLSGSNYTGADLPNISYAYSSALIDVRKKGESVSVMLFGISTKRPLAVNSRDSNVWQGWQQYVTKDDLPNIFTARLGTPNLEGNHATTIKGLWNSFPEKQVFACNLVDGNNFCVFGFIYGDHKYGAVLYLAYNDCGIVKCNSGTFSDTKL